MQIVTPQPRGHKPEKATALSSRMCFGALAYSCLSAIITEYIVIHFLGYTIARPLWFAGAIVLLLFALLLTVARTLGRLRDHSVLTLLCLLPISVQLYVCYLPLSIIGPKKLAAIMGLAAGLCFFISRSILSRISFPKNRRRLFFCWSTALIVCCGWSLFLQQLQLASPGLLTPFSFGLALFLGALLIIPLAVIGIRIIRPFIAVCGYTALVLTWAYTAATADASFFMSSPAAAETALPTAGVPTRPNIILISLDTVRAASCSLYGYSRPTTPALAAWAGQHATVYDRGIAASTWTLPSHVSIFTRQFPSEHKIIWHTTSSGGLFLPAVPDSLSLLPELLQASGYHTAGFAANYVYFSKEWNITKGFDAFSCPPQTSCSVTPVAAAVATAFFPATRDYLLPYRDAAAITDEALAFLAAPREQPFFLFLNYMDAHDPAWPPVAYRDLFLASPLARRPHRPEAASALNDRQRETFLSLYDSSLRYLDTQLARLLSHPAIENSLVIFFGDHGELFGEHDLIGHGVAPYDNVAWVPYVVHQPGQPSGAVVSKPVSLLTIYDAISSAADLSNTMPATPEIPALVQIFNQPDTGTATSALYAANWKYFSPWQGEPQLFNYLEDPGESHDRIGQEPATGRSLAAITARYAIAPPHSNNQLQEKLSHRLRGVGYLH